MNKNTFFLFSVVKLRYHRTDHRKETSCDFIPNRIFKMKWFQVHLNNIPTYINI